MAKIIVCSASGSSGKTTWSKEWVNEDPEHRVRFNRDDVRNMLGKYWSPSRENLIDNIYNHFMDEAMLAGYDIIIDNTNLNEKVLADLENLVEEFNDWIFHSPLEESHHYDIEYKKFFDTLSETCIERDSKRDNSVERNVF